jgi:hypothetical protein
MSGLGRWDVGSSVKIFPILYVVSIMLGSINLNSFRVAVAGKTTQAVVENVLLGLKPEGMMPPFAWMMVSV